jgi:hypothetical protein
MNMAKLTRKQLDEEIKVRFLEGVSEHLEAVGEEVLRVGSNELALPVVDSSGEERWLVLTFKVPTGSRDGDAYDGYSMKQDYEMKLQEKAEKQAEKEAKAAKDKAKREAQAKARVEAEAKA